MKQHESRPFVTSNLGEGERAAGSVFVRSAAEVERQDKENAEHEVLVKQKLQDRLGTTVPELHFSSAGPQVEPVKPQVPFEAKRIGSPDESVVRAEHMDLVRKIVADRQKAEAASALEHAASAATAPKGKSDSPIPNGNIYIRDSRKEG